MEVKKMQFFAISLSPFYHYIISLKYMTDAGKNTNLPVEKISQSSQTTASHSCPEELVDGCRSVQVHF